MALRKVKTKKFKTKAQATEWGLDQKKKGGPKSTLKWEVNRIGGDAPMKWEAVIFKNV